MRRAVDFKYSFQDKPYQVTVYDMAMRGEVVVYDGMSRMVGRTSIDEHKISAVSAVAEIYYSSSVDQGAATEVLCQLLHAEIEAIVVEAEL